MRGVFVKIMCSHTTKSVLIHSLLIYKYLLKERVNLLGKKTILSMVSDETLEVLVPAPAMFESQLGKGGGLKSPDISPAEKKHINFFIISRYPQNPGMKKR